MDAGFPEELRIHQRGKMAQDATHTTDGQLQGIAVFQRCVDVADIGTVERFLQEIILQQSGQDGHEIVANALHIEAHREAEPTAVREIAFVSILLAALGKFRMPFPRISLVHAVSHAVAERNAPSQRLQLRHFFATELVPERIHRHASGIGKPFVLPLLGGDRAGFHAEQETPCRVRHHRGKPGVTELAYRAKFRRGLAAFARVRQRLAQSAVAHEGFAENPFGRLLFAERLKQELRGTIHLALSHHQ